jgi:hypothetical protein
MKPRRMSWVGNVARVEASRGAYMALEGQPEGKKPLGRRRLK